MIKQYNSSILTSSVYFFCHRRQQTAATKKPTTKNDTTQHRVEPHMSTAEPLCVSSVGHGSSHTSHHTCVRRYSSIPHPRLCSEDSLLQKKSRKISRPWLLRGQNGASLFLFAGHHSLSMHPLSTWAESVGNIRRLAQRMCCVVSRKKKTLDCCLVFIKKKLRTQS